MQNLLGVGTNRGYSMIGLGIGLGVSDFRLPTVSLAGLALDAPFSTTKSLTPTVGPTPSFSRASVGYEYNSTGVLTSRAINTARFQHFYNGSAWNSRGLLIEGQVTSNATNSGLFTTGWTASNVTATTTGTGPDGGSAKLMYPSTTGTLRRLFRGMVNSRTHSVYAKASGKNFLYILDRDNTDQAFYNLSTGVVTYTPANHTATIEDVGGGWFRCSLYSPLADYTFMQFGVSDASGSTTATTNGTDGILLADDMSEATAFPTSYIAAGASATVRSADVCEITSTNFSGMWNAAQGTMVFEGYAPASGTMGLLSVNDGTANERMEIYLTGTSAKFIVVDGGVTQADLTGGTITANSLFKVAVRYQANNFAISVNGGAVVTDVAGTLPTVNKMVIGSNQAGNYAFGPVSRVRYYSTAHTNGALQGLSL